MARVEITKVIDRPVEEVFNYVAHVENTPQWGTGWLEVERTSSGPMALGATYRTVGKMAGMRIEQTYELIEHEPNRKLAARSTSGPMPTEWRYTFEPANGGTKVTAAADFEPGGFFKLAEPIVGAIARRQLEADLSNLKDILEGQSR